MTTIDTFQRLERNSEPNFCRHAATDFCINCLIYELLARRDSRYDVAAIAMFDLRRLAKLRAMSPRELLARVTYESYTLYERQQKF